MTGDGYCTTEDVRKVLQEQSLSAELNPDIVTAAIHGETEWLQERSHRHWFAPAPNENEDLLPTGPRTHDEDVLSIPSSPHPSPSQPFHHQGGVGRRRYPRPMSGRYTSVDLRRRDVTALTELLILEETGDPTDWVAAASKTEGRGGDYYLQRDDSDGLSTLYLSTTALPARSTFEDCVIATYDYGVEGVPDTVRRGVALRAAAQLVLDDDAQIGIPDNGQLVSLESKSQALRKKAADLLSIHLIDTPIA